MSTQFDFALSCFLKPDTPQDILDYLRYVTMGDIDYPDNPPQIHLRVEDYPDLGPEGDLGWLFANAKHTYGRTDLAVDTGAVLTKVYRHDRPENQGGGPVYSNMLRLRAIVYDDSLGAYLDFAKWLAPYSETEGFVGYFRGEYDDMRNPPNLIYYKEGKAYDYDAPWLPENLKEL